MLSRNSHAKIDKVEKAKLVFGRYRFLCRFKTDSYLPEYKGSTFRGVFGHALKSIVCAVKKPDCRSCLLINNCVYALVFEAGITITPPENPIIFSPSPPFVIEPPLTRQTGFKKGDVFDFSLLLFGNINNNLPYFIYAAEEAGKTGIGKMINGKRGKFRLESVYSDGRMIYSVSGKMIKESEDMVKYLVLPVKNNLCQNISRIKIILDTPLRFKSKNHLSSYVYGRAYRRGSL